ncbi:DUF6263 family protein [Aquimarina sediminis]|uniref:DUF6263 family protein n=1 Tax=Aquimarina sediminis TaxID=2070536 RepID=UPI000CA02182|nr:DUF6263 family protein [Aquimarina sediminis]
MKKQAIFIFLLLLFFTGFSQTKLQYNLTTGDSFSLHQDAEQIITQDISGNKQIIINKISADISFLVTKEESDLLYIELKYKTFKMKINSPTLGDLMNIDTSINPKPNDIQGLIFQGLINSPITIVMQKNGKINALEGADSLFDSMIKSANITDPATIKKIRATLNKQWGNKELIASFEQMTFIYDANKGIIGDIWENEYIGKMKSKNKWEITTINNESTTVTGIADVEMSNTDDNVTIIVTGSQKSEIIVNNKTGVLKEGITEGICKGHTLIPAMGDTKIPTSIEFKNNYKTIK